MRHAFVQLRPDSDRCAKCLRRLDCAPHLPIAPPSLTGEQIRAHRSYIPSGIQRPAAHLLGAFGLAPAVSRAAR